jgi:two-component system, NtrC family, sensor histidine kinase HydH
VVGMVAVFAAVTALALDAGRRDRSTLVSAFADERLSRLRIAVREAEVELAAIEQHLELATRLVDVADSGTGQRKELEALLAVVPAYQMIVVYDAEGRESAVAMGARAAAAWSRVPFSQELQRIAQAAMVRQSLVISTPLGDPAAPWERAFATPLSGNGQARGALVLVVDQKSSFERLRLVGPEPRAKLVLLGPHGRPTPLTDPELAAAADDPAGPLEDVLSRMKRGQTGTTVLSVAEARSLGLGTAEAVAAFTPIRAEDADHWSVAIVETTASLGWQEHAIVVRMGLLAAVFALALGGLCAYLVVSARRTIGIKERLKNAEQVAHLREKAEKILENAPVGVLALDDQERVSGCNRAFRDRIAPAALGSPMAEAFPDARPEALQALTQLVSSARASARVVRIVDPPLVLAGGGGEFAVHAVPLDHPSPDLGVLLVVDDVTEIRALSSQLLRAEKLATVGVLAAGIAHEVGTPLGVVRGRAELLASRLGSAHDAESARVIVAETDRISRTIREMLDFSRVARASAPAAVPLGGVVANVLELLAFEARSRKVHVSVEAGAVPPLAANEDQLKQVLVNLTLNAIQACREGGRVVLRASVDPLGKSARIEVSDDGVGIPEALKHRVFDPFFTTKKRGKGTGLGLTVAAQIVRNHGGEMDLDSAVGRGTTVVVSWPLAEVGSEVIHGEAEGRAHTGG